MNFVFYSLICPERFESENNFVVRPILYYRAKVRIILHKAVTNIHKKCWTAIGCAASAPHRCSLKIKKNRKTWNILHQKAG
ncbi:hypothetical protein HMPREF1870_01896 [Bacteroidales bacterium KA00344]|nr:hypothetical protein HMPREF1870_01896 [Bacteroidales bacterium KA00344]